MTTDDVNTGMFKIAPIVAWFIMCSSLFFVAVFIVVSWSDLISNPSRVPVSVWAGAAGFVGCFALGLYYKTLRILVSDTTLNVTSVFGHHVTLLSDIGSVVIKDNGQWRTMDVKNKGDKRVLYISTTGFSGFDELADLLSVNATGRVKS